MVFGFRGLGLRCFRVQFGFLYFIGTVAMFDFRFVLGASNGKEHGQQHGNWDQTGCRNKRELFWLSVHVERVALEC